MQKIEITCPDCGYQFGPSETHHKWVRNEVEKELQKTRQKLIEKVKAETDQKIKLELSDLKNQIEEKRNALTHSQNEQLLLRKKIRSVEEKEKILDLTIEKEVQSKVQAQVNHFKNSSLKNSEEAFKLRLMEKDKKIREIEDRLEAAKRSAHQGSQETQGEAVEMEFERQLQIKFPIDNFTPVPKGIEGADLVQTVHNTTGRKVGTILWEFKNTKTFNQNWINKLKVDQRNLGAHAALLVTKTLPRDASLIECIEGIFVVSFEIAIPFAATLRKSIAEINYTRATTQGQDEKMKLIYSYLTGPEFKQKVTSIVHAFEMIKGQLDKEKRAFKKMWASREKMLEQVIDSVTSMYGDIEGIAGNATPTIEGLSLPESDFDYLEESSTLPQQ